MDGWMDGWMKAVEASGRRAGTRLSSSGRRPVQVSSASVSVSCLCRCVLCLCLPSFSLPPAVPVSLFLLQSHPSNPLVDEEKRNTLFCWCRLFRWQSHKGPRHTQESCSSALLCALEPLGYQSINQPSSGLWRRRGSGLRLGRISDATLAGLQGIRDERERERERGAVLCCAVL
jgi:hypothetical protein